MQINEKLERYRVPANYKNARRCNYHRQQKARTEGSNLPQSSCGRRFFLPLITLEGIDKAGKDTQAKRLGRRLIEAGYTVKNITFPDYSTPLGKEIKRFLEGEFDLRPEVRQLLYVANRWEREGDIEEWLERGVFVIADRYIPSGLAYGLANELDLNWMLQLEEGLPKANFVIVIDISVDESCKREAGRDIYERNKSFLNAVRSCYLKLANRYGWVVVNGETNIDDLSKEIWKRVVSRMEV